MAKGQMRSSKEKRKPKAEWNKKKKGGPPPAASGSAQPQIGSGSGSSVKKG